MDTNTNTPALWFGRSSGEVRQHSANGMLLGYVSRSYGTWWEASTRNGKRLGYSYHTRAEAAAALVARLDRYTQRAQEAGK